MTASKQPQRPLGPHPGIEPRANPSARWITVLLGLVLLTVAVVIGRDLWYRYDDQPSNQWLQIFWDFLGAQEITGLVVTIGALVAIVGLVLLITAFVPRTRTHVRVNSPVSIWVRPVDIARKATYTTRAEFGAGSIRSRADRKSLKVELSTESAQPDLDQRVTATLNEELSRLQTPPVVTVKSSQPAVAGSSGASNTKSVNAAPADAPSVNTPSADAEKKEVK